MVNKSLMEILDTTCTQAARIACRVNSLQSTQHLRTSGAELLRAVRCSLDEVIDLIDPNKPTETPPANQDKVD